MPTNKLQFGVHLDEVILLKIKKIAEKETRSTSNLIEHLCKLWTVLFCAGDFWRTLLGLRD